MTDDRPLRARVCAVLGLDADATDDVLDASLSAAEAVRVRRTKPRLSLTEWQERSRAILADDALESDAEGECQHVAFAATASADVVDGIYMMELMAKCADCGAIMEFIGQRGVNMRGPMVAMGSLAGVAVTCPAMPKPAA